MSELTFVTGNIDKFLIASHTGAQYGLKIVQASPHIDEIQSEDSEHIARRKTDDAYKLLQKPIIVSDDSWSIVGLRGFPGPYMKSMGTWLTVDDFLRLTSTLQDRSIILYQFLIYQDVQGQQLFTNEVPGTILTEPRGEADHPWLKLVSLEGDKGKTIAQAREDTTIHHERAASKIWHEFTKWYQENRA